MKNGIDKNRSRLISQVRISLTRSRTIYFVDRRRRPKSKRCDGQQGQGRRLGDRSARDNEVIDTAGAGGSGCNVINQLKRGAGIVVQAGDRRQIERQVEPSIGTGSTAEVCRAGSSSAGAGNGYCREYRVGGKGRVIRAINAIFKRKRMRAGGTRAWSNETMIPVSPEVGTAN